MAQSKWLGAGAEVVSELTTSREGVQRNIARSARSGSPARPLASLRRRASLPRALAPSPLRGWDCRRRINNSLLVISTDYWRFGILSPLSATYLGKNPGRDLFGQKLGPPFIWAKTRALVFAAAPRPIPCRDRPLRWSRLALAPALVTASPACLLGYKHPGGKLGADSRFHIRSCLLP